MRSRSGSAMRCVGTGFVALDIIRSAFDENTTVERRHAGGSCGNVLAALSYLGLNASIVGRIGNDVAGGELIADLRRCKVDVTFLAAEVGRRTPIVIQETYVDTRGKARHRFSRACPVCGTTMPPYRPLLAADVSEVAAVLPAHDVFFFDRVAPGTLELARRSRKQGALVVFEPSGIKDEDLFVECLRVSHVFKYSHEWLSALDPLVSRARVPVEIETLGAEGLRFRVRRSGRTCNWQHLPALQAQSIRDSAGSGDWCTAGFLARFVGNDADNFARLADADVLVDSLRFGQALAALNCSYNGARGLMYALGRSGALKAAALLLADNLPKLPRDPLPAPAEPRFDRACLFCAAESTPCTPDSP
jgi:fructokinase